MKVDKEQESQRVAVQLAWMYEGGRHCDATVPPASAVTLLTSEGAELMA